MSSKRILIPSIQSSSISRIQTFKKYFREVEFDFYGLPKTPNMKERGLIFHIARHIRSEGMAVYSLHLRGFRLSDDRKKDASQAIDLLKFVYPLFKPRCIVVHPGNGEPQSLIDNLAFLVERVPPELMIVLENMTQRRSIIHSPETTAAIVEKMGFLPANVGICIDTSHPLDSGQADYTDLVLEHMRAAHPRLKHLQVSDKGDSKHLPIGQGKIDWVRIRSYIEGSGYGGKAALEIRTRDSEFSTIRSACIYYGCDAKDLKAKSISRGMARSVTKRKIINEAKKRFQMPESVIPLLEVPKTTSIEEGARSTYYIVPSSNYQPDHEDPYYSLTGGNENLGWADYLFGFREDAGKLHVLLIDRRRRIAVEQLLSNIYSGAAEYNWHSFENAVKLTLEAAEKHPDANHVQFTAGQTETIDQNDTRAWL